MQAIAFSKQQRRAYHYCRLVEIQKSAVILILWGINDIDNKIVQNTWIIVNAAMEVGDAFTNIICDKDFIIVRQCTSIPALRSHIPSSVSKDLGIYPSYELC